jgi:hypothetical protein
MSHSSWLDSIRVSLGRPRAGPAPRRSLRSSHMSLGLHQSWFRMLVGLSLGKVRRKFDPLRATSEAPRRVHESRLLWHRMRAALSLGTVRDNFNVLGGNSRAATLRARITPVVGVRMRAAPLSGGSVAFLTCWGQPWYNPRRVRESRLSWPLDTHRSSLGSDGQIRSPGACSRAATLRE